MYISFEKAHEIAEKAHKKLNCEPIMMGDCYWTLLFNDEVELDVSYEYEDGNLIHVVELVDYAQNEMIDIASGDGTNVGEIADTIFYLINNKPWRF